jgi:hypothetical protein
MGLTPLAISTTSLTPTSPRVAATTSGGRPKTETSRPISASAASRNSTIWTLTSLGDLADTRVLVVESSDESQRLAPEVDLVMDRTLGEERSLTCADGVEDESSTVLLDESGLHLAVNDKQELGGSGMGVGAVHSARSGEWFRVRVVVDGRNELVRLTPSERQPWPCRSRRGQGSWRHWQR